MSRLTAENQGISKAMRAVLDDSRSDSKQMIDILDKVKLMADESQYQSAQMLKVAEGTRDDGMTMKNLATISMAFIPPTFICVCVSCHSCSAHATNIRSSDLLQHERIQVSLRR